MSVHFIGAGPGAADLITVRGRDLLGQCPVCLYAGSIVPPDLLRYCPAGARLVDTAPLTLDDIETECVPAFAAAAALLRRELTVPQVAQSVILTRMPGRASPMPAAERLHAFAATGATLVLHLAIQAIKAIVPSPWWRARLGRTSASCGAPSPTSAPSSRPKSSSAPPLS